MTTTGSTSQPKKDRADLEIFIDSLIATNSVEPSGEFAYWLSRIGMPFTIAFYPLYKARLLV